MINFIILTNFKFVNHCLKLARTFIMLIAFWALSTIVRRYFSNPIDEEEEKVQLCVLGPAT